MERLSGFIDSRHHFFYQKSLVKYNLRDTLHETFAWTIIEERGWKSDYTENYYSHSCVDYLVYKHGFFQIGNCNEKVIVTDNKDESYIWRAIAKSLTPEQFEEICRYKLYRTLPPRDFRK